MHKILQQIKVIMDASPALYGPMSPQAVADKMNDKSISKLRDSIPGSELFDYTDSGEYVGLTASQKQQWLSLCSIDVIGKNAVPIIRDIFPASTTTWKNIVKTKQVSIADQSGLGTILAHQVELARGL